MLLCMQDAYSKKLNEAGCELKRKQFLLISLDAITKDSIIDKKPYYIKHYLQIHLRRQREREDNPFYF